MGGQEQFERTCVIKNLKKTQRTGNPNMSNDKIHEILRQITTKKTIQCCNCIHKDVCLYYNDVDLAINLARICKHAEEIIIQENKND
jgi:hypothetical protein